MSALGQVIAGEDGARVTKIVCPSCKGGGWFVKEFKWRCMWCNGKRRLSADDAARYANQTYMIAGGGYIAGDHDYADMRRMEGEAAQVYALLRRSPPWAEPPTT